MNSNFFSRKTPVFGTRAVLILCIVFFLAPFALRGARLAVDRMENNIADWLPDDFPETKDLKWFGKHFMGERFVLITCLAHELVVGSCRCFASVRHGLRFEKKQNTPSAAGAAAFVCIGLTS